MHEAIFIGGPEHFTTRTFQVKPPPYWRVALMPHLQAVATGSEYDLPVEAELRMGRYRLTGPLREPRNRDTWIYEWAGVEGHDYSMERRSRER